MSNFQTPIKQFMNVTIEVSFLAWLFLLPFLIKKGNDANEGDIRAAHKFTSLWA